MKIINNLAIDAEDKRVKNIIWRDAFNPILDYKNVVIQRNEYFIPNSLDSYFQISELHQL